MQSRVRETTSTARITTSAIDTLGARTRFPETRGNLKRSAARLAAHRHPVTPAAQQGPYHANIDPDARYTMTEHQWIRSSNRTGPPEIRELGLEGQTPRCCDAREARPRACPRRWWQQGTDVDTMTMVVRQLQLMSPTNGPAWRSNRSFGQHEHVPGKHRQAGPRRSSPSFLRRKSNHAEWQQTERAGIAPHASSKDTITALYRHSDKRAGVPGCT